MNPLRSLYERLTPIPVRAKLSFCRLVVTDRVARGRWIRTRRATRALKRGRFLAETPLPHARLVVDLRDVGVGLPIYIKRAYEEPETAFIRSTIRPGMVVYDVGANIGYTTTLAASLVGPTGLVAAFEPHPHNYGLLDRNVASNRFAQVRPFNVALGAAQGILSLYESDTNFGDHQLYGVPGEERQSVEVKVERLDDVCAREKLPPPDFIKIDVQGYEPFVLQGMEEILRRNRPLIVLAEYWPWGMRRAGAEPNAMIAPFRDADFTAAVVGPDGQIADSEWSRVEAELTAVDEQNESLYVNVVFRRG